MGKVAGFVNALAVTTILVGYAVIVADHAEPIVTGWWTQFRDRKQSKPEGATA